MNKNPIMARIRFRGLAMTRIGVIATLLWFGASQPDAQGQSGVPDAVASVGFVLGDIDALDIWGCVAGTQAYSARGGVCNLGTAPLPGHLLANHPMWTSNLYRYSPSPSNRFEQIGMSWIKHNPWSVDLYDCTACGVSVDGCVRISNNALDPGCADIYDCQNGLQLRLGPRSQINAWTGAWPVGSASYCNPSSGGGVTACRLQVPKTDVVTGAEYFLEEQVITPDETVAKRNNNVSYKSATLGDCETSGCDVTKTTCGETRSCTGCGDPNCVYTLTLGTTHFCQEPAIKAWKKIDTSVVETPIPVYNDGQFILAAKAWNPEGCVWEYEYALYNMNSDRSAKSFSVPLPTDLSSGELADIQSSAEFHDISYHSGDRADPACSTCVCSGGSNNGNSCDAVADCPDGSCSGLNFDDTPWASTVSGTEIRWDMVPYSPYPDNGNALRWGTLYNFRFRAPRGPNYSPTVRIDLFKDGSPSYVTGVSVAPAPVGACCTTGGACSVSGECQCAGSFKGAYTACQDCNGNTVPDACEDLDTGACCLSSESNDCVMTATSACCYALDGLHWYGLTSKCETTDCFEGPMGPQPGDPEP